jgi:hypothetical protein
MEYPKWTLPGTFKPKPGAPVKAEEEESDKNWQLESTIIEVSPCHIVIFVGVRTHVHADHSRGFLCPSGDVT